MATDLAELTDARDRAKLELETAQLREAIAQLDKPTYRRFEESFWDSFFRPNLDWGFDEPGFDLAGSWLTDRTDGSYAPILRTEQDLTRIRGNARLLADTNLTAQGILNVLADYTIGSSGYAYTVQPVKRYRDRIPQGLADAVQDVLDEILDDNDFCGDMERELFQRSRVDGEFFVGLFAIAGQVQLRCIEPDLITAPRNTRGLEDGCWEWGIRTHERDAQHVLGYHVDWSQDGHDTEVLDVRQCEHLKLNVYRSSKRGLSDFYCPHETLTDSEKLLRNIIRGGQVQAAIAWIVQHAPGVTREQIQNLAGSGTMASTRQVAAPDGSTRTVRTEKVLPGQKLHIPSGMEYKEAPGAKNAQNHLAVDQAALRRVGVRWSMPEYMISGDASNANYSSTMVAESPFVKRVQSAQEIYARSFRRIMWKALRMAHAFGRFDRFGVTHPWLERYLEISVDTPTVVVRDAEKETSRLQTLEADGIIARRTRAAEEGYDLDEEIAKGAQVVQQPALPAPVREQTLAELGRAFWGNYP